MHFRSVYVFLEVRNICRCRAIFICRGTISPAFVVFASFPRHIKFYSARIHEGGRTESARVLRHARQIIYLNVSNPQRAKLCYAICHNIFASYSYCCSVFGTS